MHEQTVEALCVEMVENETAPAGHCQPKLGNEFQWRGTYLLSVMGRHGKGKSNTADTMV